jgi:hypothetical protein
MLLKYSKILKESFGLNLQGGGLADNSTYIKLKPLVSSNTLTKPIQKETPQTIKSNDYINLQNKLLNNINSGKMDEPTVINIFDRKVPRILPNQGDVLKARSSFLSLLKTGNDSIINVFKPKSLADVKIMDSSPTTNKPNSPAKLNVFNNILKSKITPNIDNINKIDETNVVKLPDANLPEDIKNQQNNTIDFASKAALNVLLNHRPIQRK